MKSRWPTSLYPVRLKSAAFNSPISTPESSPLRISSCKNILANQADKLLAKKIKAIMTLQSATKNAHPVRQVVITNTTWEGLSSYKDSKTCKVIAFWTVVTNMQNNHIQARRDPCSFRATSLRESLTVLKVARLMCLKR